MTLPGGTRLGPYQVVELLGAGGMGEVYRARDARLGRDVAVKVLPEEVAGDTQRLGYFEREARAVAALNHPNILTVHDVGTHDGVPYVVTELLEGESFRELVSRRSPTVGQILSYALQAARGLEAAHGKDIVHRDLKPENLFLTTDGRVKILDFGLAKLVEHPAEMTTESPTPSRSTSAGQIVGTIAYMSPEQARGHSVDARSDVFSLGVVLYELLARKHPFRRDSAVATLTAIVEETPASLGDLGQGVPPAVGGIVRRCLEKGREERYASGHDAAVALEAVIAAPSGAAALLEVEERSPYPGLSSFTEKDAGVFFGREHEVEALWRRIWSRRLLAVIGPSGVGKTSFVRAGVIAGRPAGWAAIVCKPGTAPLTALARALAPQVAGDMEVVEQLLGFDDPEVALSTVGQWRRGHGEALVVIDQFEELFTLNPPEVQDRFATLLGRLAREADVHVLLSLRDDFLMRCHDQEPLVSVFTELTPLGALTVGGLERALMEPAKKRGYRFDDDTLVAEMVSLVEGVRGALPLLAFAVARLWEKRDREQKLFTREAYQEIAGVEGALAQHAESTMDRIGSERQGLVREIFRNLVTAHGTRAVIDREELLSAFPGREGAEDVLGQLIDARLLTSYEVEGSEEEASHHRIEVVHESLLKAWPRLVRWQTQDEDSAQLRDQLKQAAHLWEEKGRTPDLLWSGTAFQEFELWRTRYAGALTAVEDQFGQAMVDRSRRRRRWRRIAVALVVVGLSVVAGTIAVSRHQEAAARRQAEAAELLALGRLELDAHPTAGLAYALASLEMTDTLAARRFALESLAHGGAASILPIEAHSVDFSPDGRWLATGTTGEGARLWSREGGPPVSLGNTVGVPHFQFDRLRPLLSILDQKAMWTFSLPDAKLIHELDTEGVRRFYLRDSRLFTFVDDRRGTAVHTQMVGEGDARLLWRWDGADVTSADVNSNGQWLAYTRDRRVLLLSLEDPGTSPRLVGEHPAAARWVVFSPGDDRLVSSDVTGEIRIWSTQEGVSPLERTIHSGLTRSIVLTDHTVSRLIAGSSGVREPAAAAPRLWDLNAPPDADPVALRKGDVTHLLGMSIDGTGRWLATANNGMAVLWPLEGRRAHVLRGQAPPFIQVAFTPDGKWLASHSPRDSLRLWPLSPAVASRNRVLIREGEEFPRIAVGPDSRKVLLVSYDPGRALLVPLDGGAPRVLQRSSPGWLDSPAISRDGRLAAAGSRYRRDGNVIELWNLSSGEVRTLDPHSTEKECGSGMHTESAVLDVEFTSDGGLLSAGFSGLRLWNLDEGTNTLLRECGDGPRLPLLGGSREDRFLLVELDNTRKTSLLSFHDLRPGVSRELTSHGSAVRSVALDPRGEIAVTGGYDGIVRVGGIHDEEPHLLYGHDLEVTSVAVSPDGQWIASGSNDGTIRLWPMPTGQPFHTLPHEELLSRLRSFTNLRVVRDEGRETGYRVEAGPFPGWATVPEW